MPPTRSKSPRTRSVEIVAYCFREQGPNCADGHHDDGRAGEGVGQAVSCVHQSLQPHPLRAEHDFDGYKASLSPDAALHHAPTGLGCHDQCEDGSDLHDCRIGLTAVGKHVPERKSCTRSDEQDDIERPGKSQQAPGRALWREGYREHCRRGRALQ